MGGCRKSRLNLRLTAMECSRCAPKRVTLNLTSMPRGAGNCRDKNCTVLDEGHWHRNGSNGRRENRGMSCLDLFDPSAKRYRHYIPFLTVSTICVWSFSL